MIVIAGGTGRMGRDLALRLVERGLPIRILVRDPGRIPEVLRGRVEAVRADVREPASLAPALEGADTVVSAITGFGGPGAEGAKAVDGDGNIALIDAAESTGAEHLVLLSVRRAGPDSPVALFREKHRAEERLERSRMTGTIVRPTAYMETWIDVVGRPLVTTGRTRVFGRGDNPINFVSATDVAALTELAVVDGTVRGSVIDAVGPENLSMNELIETVRRVTGATGQVDHASRAVMRVLATVLRAAKPILADQIRAGLVMDTADMRVDPAERMARFPLVPMTTLEDAVRRQLSPVTAAAIAPAHG
jgi:uncharacterized protein YbjT (DUF2867 family)